MTCLYSEARSSYTLKKEDVMISPQRRIRGTLLSSKAFLVVSLICCSWLDVEYLIWFISRVYFIYWEINFENVFDSIVEGNLFVSFRGVLVLGIVIASPNTGHALSRCEALFK